MLMKEGDKEEDNESGRMTQNAQKRGSEREDEDEQEREAERRWMSDLRVETSRVSSRPASVHTEIIGSPVGGILVLTYLYFSGWEHRPG